MSLSELKVRSVRCIEGEELEIRAGLSLLWGRNGWGGTSVLEAVSRLRRGRSFLKRNNGRLICGRQDHLRVIARASSSFGELQPMVLEVTWVGAGPRPAASPAESLSELSQASAVQVIEPGIHKLIEEGGYHRRRWRDWGGFHVERECAGRVVRRQSKTRRVSARLDRPSAELGFSGRACCA